MKKGLVALMLLSLVAAIPACRQRDCLDKCRPCDEPVERVERKCCLNPCGWFKCKPKCERAPRVKRERSKCCRSFCDMFRCKPRCEEEVMVEEEEVMPMREEVSRERVIREDMAPAAPRRLIK